jgi:hypothetical protein
MLSLTIHRGVDVSTSTFDQNAADANGIVQYGARPAITAEIREMAPELPPVRRYNSFTAQV